MKNLFNLRQIIQATKSNHVFYKIINVKKSTLILQCINSNATFSINFSELMTDDTILNHLYPTHACYAGMCYADFANDTQNDPMCIFSESLNQYGKYHLYSKGREGNICFQNKQTKELIIMKLDDLIYSSNILREFSAKQSFYLGIIFRAENNYNQNKQELTRQAL